MKTAIATIVILCIATGSAGAYLYGAAPRPLPPMPKYLLVSSRVESINCSGTGGVYSPCSAYLYRYEGVTSPEAAARLLTDESSRRFLAPSLIGLWRLDDKNRVELRHNTITHKKEVRVEEEAWDEHVWSVEPTP